MKYLAFWQTMKLQMFKLNCILLVMQWSHFSDIVHCWYSMNLLACAVSCNSLSQNRVKTCLIFSLEIKNKICNIRTVSQIFFANLQSYLTEIYMVLKNLNVKIHQVSSSVILFRQNKTRRVTWNTSEIHFQIWSFLNIFICFWTKYR